jgi:riboflavin transporter FmnP
METSPASSKPFAISSTQKITGIALFTAVSVVLTKVYFPAPYALFLQYEIWEIPITIAFLMLGIRAGVLVTIANFVILLLVNQGALITGPLYNLVAILSMLLGIGIAHKAIARSRRGFSAILSGATFLGIVFRTTVMVLFNGIFLRFPYPIGFGIPSSAIPLSLVPIAFFNASLALYTIPLSYWALNAVSSRYKIRLAFPLNPIPRQSGNTLL